MTFLSLEPPSFMVESTFSSSCSRFDRPLSRQGTALAHLDSLTPHDLMFWTDGSVPFFFGKGGSGVFANCSLCGTEATLSFSAGQYAQVSLLKPAPICKLFANLDKPATSLLLSDSCSSPPYPLLHLSFYLNLSGRSRRNCLLCPPVLSSYNGSPDTRFSQEMTRLMSWSDKERYSCPLQTLVVSLLLSLVSTLLFYRTGGILSHRNSLTHRFPRFPLRNLCFLITLAVCSLVYAATDTAYC